MSREHQPPCNLSFKVAPLLDSHKFSRIVVTSTLVGENAVTEGSRAVLKIDNHYESLGIVEDDTVEAVVVAEYSL